MGVPPLRVRRRGQRGQVRPAPRPARVPARHGRAGAGGGEPARPGLGHRPFRRPRACGRSPAVARAQPARLRAHAGQSDSARQRGRGRAALMATVLWARHGQNVANLSQTFSYRVFDGDPTETGREQALRLADRLAGQAGDPVRLLACSPLRRARQTADIIGRRLGLPVAMELEDLREVNVGALDGRSDPEAWDTYTRVLRAWREGEAGARFPGGEDRDELCARLGRALAAVARRAGEVTSLVVAHGANLRAAV